MKCFKCEKELPYDENSDKENNMRIFPKIRKMVIDENKVSVPFYKIPQYIQRMIDPKFIKFVCNECLLKNNKRIS